MPPGIDTTKPHPARVYDYYLGGKDHFAVDEETGEKAALSWPAVRTGVRENRAFLSRAVEYLTAEAGIRQFLDIGAGLPTANNVHEVAQRIAPEARIVYVDNDPLILTQAETLLTSTPQGRTAYIEADLRTPEAILASAAVRETLDLGQPVGLILAAVLHFIVDADDPAGIVATLLGALPAGSYLAATHVTPEYDPVGVAGLVRTYNQGGIQAQARTAEQFKAIAFSGLELIEPGVVVSSEWRPTASERPLASDVNFNGGVGLKR